MTLNCQDWVSIKYACHQLVYKSYKAILIHPIWIGLIVVRLITIVNVQKISQIIKK